MALKHHTSKLSTFTDIASLQTFGFRGEALSSLCALSNLAVTTCIQADVPKGSRLSFEPSGQLGNTVIVAAQRGTIVSVDSLFHNLPVRRRELERNIKREWQKVVALLSQYACIQTNVKLSVWQQPNQGKRVALFSTKGNPTTRENIINIFGAKTMSALVSMELDLVIQPTATAINPEPTADAGTVINRVCVVGHISRPSPGDGRLTPDRQMFFVNGRPCGLPQFAKTFNEVYRSFNHSQSPFIFADVRLDTQLYDVNVSPDKRSILLHDQGRLLDTLRTSLVTLFGSHDCAVPLSQLRGNSYGLHSRNGLARPTTESLVNSKVRPGKTLVGESRSSDDAAVGSSDDSASDSGAESSRHNVDADVNRPRHRPNKEQSLMSQWLKKDARTTASSAAYASARSGSRPTSRRGRGSDPNTLASDATGTCLSVQAFAASQGGSLISSRLVRDFDSRLADNTALATTEHEIDDIASSVHNLTDDDELREEPDVRAVWPLRLGNRSSTHPLPFRSPPTCSALSTAGIVSATGDGKLVEASRTSNKLGEPGSREPSRKIAGSASEPNEDAPTSAGPGPGGMGSILGKSSARLHKYARPGNDGDTNDLRSYPSGDASSLSSNELDAIATQPASPNPGVEACLELTSEASPKAQPTVTGFRRSNMLWQAVQRLLVDEETIRSRMNYLKTHLWTGESVAPTADQVEDIGASDAESKLTLTISRGDFSAMRVVGQFNMGFVIAVRPATSEATLSRTARHDELFIIDQHASDEKYNFERLQSTTTVQSQRLVHPRKLQLTALEEEIVMENLAAIEANGFKVAVDAGGDSPVGSRCEVLALPLSRETTFSIDDLGELIALLGDEPTESEHVPRPSKVRRMFAMRACRSSVMIGKALTRNQMYGLVRQMGELDKPWNCPHGRPTMRHLCRLQAWDEKRWVGDAATCSTAAWRSYGRGD